MPQQEDRHPEHQQRIPYRIAQCQQQLQSALVVSLGQRLQEKVPNQRADAQHHRNRIEPELHAVGPSVQFLREAKQTGKREWVEGEVAGIGK